VFLQIEVPSLHGDERVAIGFDHRDRRQPRRSEQSLPSCCPL
jgi:hypothetical protein